MRVDCSGEATGASPRRVLIRISVLAGLGLREDPSSSVAASIRTLPGRRPAASTSSRPDTDFSSERRGDPGELGGA